VHFQNFKVFHLPLSEVTVTSRVFLLSSLFRHQNQIDKFRAFAYNMDKITHKMKLRTRKPIGSEPPVGGRAALGDISNKRSAPESKKKNYQLQKN